MLPHLSLYSSTLPGGMFSMFCCMSSSGEVIHSPNYTSEVKCVASTTLLYPLLQLSFVPLSPNLSLPSPWQTQPVPRSLKVCLLSVMGMDPLVPLLWPYKNLLVHCLPKCQISVTSFLPPHCLWGSSHKVIHNDLQDSPVCVSYTSVLPCTCVFPRLILIGMPSLTYVCWSQSRLFCPSHILLCHKPFISCPTSNQGNCFL